MHVITHVIHHLALYMMTHVRTLQQSYSSHVGSYMCLPGFEPVLGSRLSCELLRVAALVGLFQVYGL